MWQAIQYVTSGFTLAAFIAAVIASVLKRQADNKLKAIQSAPEEKKADLVRDALEFFHIDSTGLTREQQHDLAVKQIQERAARFRITAIVVVLLALIAALLSAFAISRVNPYQANSQEPEHQTSHSSGDQTSHSSGDQTSHSSGDGTQTKLEPPDTRANPQPVQTGSRASDAQASVQPPSPVPTAEAAQTHSQPLVDKTWAGAWENVLRIRPTQVVGAPPTQGYAINTYLTLSIEVTRGNVLAGVLDLSEQESDANTTDPMITFCSAKYRLEIRPVANSKNATFSGHLIDYFGKCKVNNPVEIEGELLRGTDQTTEYIKVLVGDNDNIKDLSDLHLVKSLLESF